MLCAGRSDWEEIFFKNSANNAMSKAYLRGKPESAANLCFGNVKGFFVMQVLVFVKITDAPISQYQAHPLVNTLADKADWVTVELDSFSESSLINVARNLMQRSQVTIFFVDVVSSMGTATPFHPLIQLALSAPDKHHFLLQGGSHHLVERLIEEKPQAPIIRNPTEADWDALISTRTVSA